MPDDVESQVKQIENMLLLLKQSMTNKTVENQNDEVSEPLVTRETEPFQALFHDKTELLSLTEAANLFSLESKSISEMPFKPVAGSVYLFKGNEKTANDWRSNGHRWYQVNGGKWVLNGKVKRRVSNCVTEESGKKGTNAFQMITWIHKDYPLSTLLQFVGDDSISKDFPHGNSKHSNVNYHRSAASLIRDLEVTSDKPSKTYSSKVSEAQPDISSQKFKVPRNISSEVSSRN